MALKDIMQRMQGLADKVSARREDGQKVPQTTMPNGSVSGYTPPVGRRKYGVAGHSRDQAGSAPLNQGTELPPLQRNAPPRPMAQAMETQESYGNQASSQPMPPPAKGRMHSWTRRERAVEHQPQGSSTGNQPPVQQPQQGYTMGGQPPVQPQQGYAMGGQPPVQPQPAYNMGNQPPVQSGPYQPRHQESAQSQWQGGYPQQNPYAQPVHATVPQPVQPPVNATVPQQPVQQNPAPNVSYINAVVDERGNTYAMVLRVAQITGIPSCYHLLEFMQGDEMVIVNAEQITDTMEANRCMDMLFGAASAMNLTFERIAGRLIYLIAPRRVNVMPCENLRYMSRADRENRWPGVSYANGQDSRYDDFQSGRGQRSGGPRHAQYADRGGFGGFGSRR